jgi:hypothetical protein
MARTPRWKYDDSEAGISHVKLSSWKYFSDFINQELLDYTTFVYRGHGNSSWLLEPTLDRIIKSPKSPKRDAHLTSFKFETRGRRGTNPSNMDDENDWWALGQHHGLATPLLDWTESPFVALYFAAIGSLKERSKNISVFAIGQSSIRVVNNEVMKDDSVDLINDRKPIVSIVRPQSDENNRLVNQRGLFTRGPNNMDMEEWIKKYYPEGRERRDLIKIIIPATGIQDCLRYLNRMNINHSTLFPDLTGASEYCNRHLVLAKY